MGLFIAEIHTASLSLAGLQAFVARPDTSLFSALTAVDCYLARVASLSAFSGAARSPVTPLFLPNAQEAGARFLEELGGGRAVFAAVGRKEGGSKRGAPAKERPITAQMRDRIQRVLIKIESERGEVTHADRLEAVGMDPIFNDTPALRARFLQAAVIHLREKELAGENIDTDQLTRLEKQMGKLPTVLLTTEEPLLTEEIRTALLQAGIPEETLESVGFAPSPKSEKEKVRVLVGLDPVLFGRPRPPAASSPSLAAVEAVRVDISKGRRVPPMPGLVSEDGCLLLAASAGEGGGIVPIDSGMRDVRLLAVGGMGMVFVVEHRQPFVREAAGIPPIPVVAKVLKTQLLADRRMWGRFYVEYWVGRLLNHPNILPVFQLGIAQDGRPIMFSAYQRGWPKDKKNRKRDEQSVKNVGDLIEKYGYLPLDEGLALFLPVVGAVVHAHEKGVIHRDIKPDNIVIDEIDSEPVFKLMDWGVAHVVGGPNFDKPGNVVGTPGYMSFAVRGGQVGEEGDVFALGVSLYEILTGKHPTKRTPFTGQTEIRAPSSENGSIPKELDEIILRAMGYEKEPPYKKAAALYEALGTFIKIRTAHQSAASDLERALFLRNEALGLFKDEMSRAEFEIWRRKMESAIVAYEAALGKLTGEEDALYRETFGERGALLWALYETAEQFGVEDDFAPRLVPYPRYVAMISEASSLTVILTQGHREKAVIKLVTFSSQGGVFREEKTTDLPDSAIDHLPKELPKGVYALRVEAEGYVPMQIPFIVRRREAINLSFPLIGTEEIPEGFAVVPPGNVVTDRDPAFFGAHPKEIKTVPYAYAVKPTLVTNAEYIEFLNGLIAQGRIEEALERVPREGREPLWHREVIEAMRAGRPIQSTIYFAKAGSDERDEPVVMEQPVIWVSAMDAEAWAKWRSTSALKVQLPSREELLRLCRGNDARLRPWGDAVDYPGASNVRSPRWAPPLEDEQSLSLSAVGTHPLDQSPFSHPQNPIGDVFGNAREWTREQVKLGDGTRYHYSFGSGFALEGGTNIVTTPFLQSARALPHGFRVVMPLTQGGESN